MQHSLGPDPYTIYMAPERVDSKVGSTILGFLPLYAALIAGTGGAYALPNVAAASEMVARPLVTVVGYRAKSDPAIGIAPHIERIRSVLRLNMSEIASLFGVSRPAAYAWLSGTKPKREIEDNIWRFIQFVDHFESAGLGRSPDIIRRPLSDGRSALSLIRDVSREENFDSIIATLQNADARDKHAAQRFTSVRRSKIWVSDPSDISPVLIEREPT